MEIKILQVFYGKDGLPYKDQERKVHFPIIGNGFQGASNTTKIKFYFGELGDSNVTWVATAKLPNGKIGSKVLESYEDTTLNEDYALLELSDFYFQYKGDVFITLQGYQGGVQVEYNSQTELYTIHGTPTIQATGSIKLAVNYATQFIGSGEEDNVTMQQLMAALGEKADADKVVYITGLQTITGIKTFSNDDGGIHVHNSQNIDTDTLTTYSDGLIIDVKNDTRHVLNIPEENGTIATREYVNNHHDATKQDKLIAGENITIVDNVISATGGGGGGGDEYELIANKVTSIDNESTNTQYPSAKCVYDVTQNIREVAEGKCKSWVLSYNASTPASYIYSSYKKLVSDGNGGYVEESFDSGNDLQDYLSNKVMVNSSFNSQTGNLEIPLVSSTKYTYIVTNKNVIITITQLKDLIKIGDIIWVSELEVPDRWYASTSGSPVDLKLKFQILETSKVDLSGYFAKNESLIPTSNGTQDIGSSSYAWKDLYLSGSAYIPTIEDSSAISFKINGTERFKLTGADAITGILYPSINNTFDLGTSSLKYKDIYLSGTAYIGSGSQITQSGDGSLQITLSGDGKSLKPSWDEHYNLGSIGYKWKDGYFSGSLTNTGSRSIDGLCGKYASPTVSSNTVELPYDTISSLSLSADTTITLQSAPTGCYPEYRALITANAAITLTFTGVGSFLTNDEDNVVVTNATNTTIALTNGTTIEISIVNGNGVAINFEVA